MQVHFSTSFLGYKQKLSLKVIGHWELGIGNWELEDIRDFQIKKYSTTSCGVGNMSAFVYGRSCCPPHKIE